MKPTARIRSFLLLAGSTLLAVSFSSAATYYWDSNATAGGWGTAVGGIWAEPTTSRWTTGTNSTTATDLSRTILLADSVNFGDGSANTLTGGTIAVTGNVDATNITFGSSAGQIILDGGIITLAAAASITVNNATNTVTSEIAGAGTSLTKTGSGILVLTGANSYTGSTIINGGTINLGGGGVTGSLASTVLTLAGGAALNYTRSDSQTETFTTTNINGGGTSSLSATTGNILNLGTVTRGTGGVLDFGNVGAGTVAALAASNDATGIMAGLHAGNSWAVANGAGVAISGLLDGSYTLTSVATTTAASYANFNIDVDDNSGVPAAGITANSLRFSQAEANTLTLTGANTITSGGILVGSGVGSNLSTITGGTLTGLANKDLSIIQNSTGGLTISSSIINTTSTSVTKSGAGLLTLAGNNTFTGGLTINAGKVALDHLGALNSTANSENAVTFGAGSTGTLAMNGRSVVIRSLNTNANNAGSAIVENGNATPATLTIGNSANAISTFGGVIRDGTGGGALTITKVGTGALNLGISNTYTGGTNLNGATSFTFRPGMFGTGIITVNANTTMDVDYGAFSTYTNALHVNGGVTLTTTGSTQFFGQTFSGAVTGSGIIKTAGSGNNSNSNNKLGLTSASNTFTGTLVNEGGSAVINVNSLGDGGKIQLKTGTGGLQLGTGTATSLLFDTRVVELFGSSVLQNDNASAAITFTVNTALTYNGAGVRTLTLQGTNTGNNAFNGLIADNAGPAAVSITKAEGGTWILGNAANTYTGATNVSGGILQVSTLADGSGNSSIGASGSGAGNLILNGGTLRYTGGAVDTDRLFSLQFTGTSTIDASGTGALNFENTGAMGFNGGTGNKTLALTGTNTGNNTIAAVIGNNTGTTAITKNGIGTWVLSGANSNTGNTTISGGGNLILDYGTQDNNKIAGILTLSNGGGDITLRGGSHLEAVTSLTFGTGGGHTHISREGVSTAKLALGAITRGQGNGFTMSLAADSLATTTSVGANGILSGGILVGSNWAKVSGGDIVALTSGDYSTLSGAGTTATLNYRLTGPLSRGAASVNSLRIEGTGTDDVLTITSGNLSASQVSVGDMGGGASGGFLYVGGGNNNYTITGSGNLGAQNANQEVIIHTLTGTLTVDMLLAMGNTNGPLTKSGAGTLVLTKNNTYTAATYVNQGTLRVNGNQTTATGTVTVNNGAALGGTGTLGGNVTIAAGGGLTFDLTTASGSHNKLELALTKTLTFSGASTLTITSSGGTPGTGTYTLLTAPGGITGSVPTTVNLPGGWTADAPQIVGNDLRINITSTGGGGSAYDTWKAANAPGSNPDDDTDGDGVSNAVEFVLGGTSLTKDLEKLPVPDASGSNLTFIFERAQSSIDPKTAVFIETSTDLATWNALPSPYTVPDGVTAGPPVTVVKGVPINFDTVTLTVPQAPDAMKFARLKVVITP